MQSGEESHAALTPASILNAATWIPTPAQAWQLPLLVPCKYQSGTTDRNGRITKAGDAMVRTALYEAANVLLTRVTRWSPLKAWAVRLAQRIGGKRAKVALARKLAVILHRIWIDGTTFTWTRERAMAAV